MTLTTGLVPALPVLAPLLGAVLVLLVDAARPGGRLVPLALAGVALLAGAGSTLPGVTATYGTSRSTFCTPAGPCSYLADGPTSTLQLVTLLAALAVLVLALRDWREDAGAGRPPVVAALVLAATAGAVSVPAAGDLGTLMVSLELATLPAVALALLVRPSTDGTARARAVDGGVALLTTSLVSFALAVLGAALWVAAHGTAFLLPPAATTLGGAQAVPVPPAASLLTALAVALLASGLAFKLSAVPFHSWTPVTYARAPLPVTIFLATVSKAAALGSFVVLVRAVGPHSSGALVVLALLSALSMTVGNLVALVQRDLVRLLAWSTVAQAGWLLLPLSTGSTAGSRAAISYLLVYLPATLVAFAVVQLVGRSLASHRALLRRRPWLTVALGLALLTLAGIPPAVSGLVAKVVVLRPVAGAGTWWLAVVAAVNVALGLAVYLRWVGALLEREHTDTGNPAETKSTPRLALAVIGLLSALLVLGSMVPVWVL